MWLRFFGIVGAATSLLACQSSAAAVTNHEPDPVPRDVMEMPRFRIEENLALNEVLHCEPVKMAVTSGPSTAIAGTNERHQQNDRIALTLRCKNLSAVPIRAFRANVALDDVFKEALLKADAVEHVWAANRALNSGATADALLPPLRSEVRPHSDTSRFLRTAQLGDLGERAVTVSHIAFVDGTVARLVEHKDEAALVIRYTVERIK